MKIILMIVVALGLAMPSVAWADVVELKSGERVEGSFQHADAGGVAVMVGGQVVTFTLDKVRAVYFGAAPRMNTPPPSPAKEALTALEALRSVTTGGVTYRDYAPRVSDAKIIVDRFLHGQNDDPSRAAIADALNFYVAASTAWSYRIRNQGYRELLIMKPLMERCVSLKQVVEQTRPKDDFAVGFAIAQLGPPALWVCAADKIAEAGRLLAE